MFTHPLKVYIARGMSGRIKEEVVKEAITDKAFFEAAGFIVLDPVTSEKIKSENKPLRSTKKHMDKYWTRDKQMIREAHAVIDMTPHLKSAGVEHEIGYARYFLYKPVVRVFPFGQLPDTASIFFYEDDCVVDSREEAVEFLLRVHGTWFKRLNWRLQMYRRCRAKALWYEIKEWFK